VRPAVGHADAPERRDGAGLEGHAADLTRELRPRYRALERSDGRHASVTSVVTLKRMKADDVVRRKPAAKRKENWIRLRVTDEQKERMMEAAERAGLSLSAWLRMVTLRAAQAGRRGEHA
jgi:predicted GIY-YIG superfamily endonuclease